MRGFKQRGINALLYKLLLVNMWIILQTTLFLCNQIPLNKLLCHRTCDARGRRAGPAFWCDGGTRARGNAIKLVARVTTVCGYRVLDGGRVGHKTVGWALKSPTICHIKSVRDDSSWYTNLLYSTRLLTR